MEPDHVALAAGFARMEAQLEGNSKKLDTLENMMGETMTRLRHVEGKTEKLFSGVGVGKWVVGLLISFGFIALAIIQLGDKT